MDLHMPEGNGIAATRQIVATSPHIRVLVLTMLDDDDSVYNALRAGAAGYLLKGAGQDELVRAIVAVAAGEAIFGPAVARRVLGAFSNQPAAAAEPFPQLTSRERQVLELVADGQPNAVIGRGLCISPKTVRNHVANVLTKLQVADRAQAALLAREAGLGSPAVGHSARDPRAPSP